MTVTFTPERFVMVKVPTPLQKNLFEESQTAIDSKFGTLVRVRLDDASWVDHARGWVRGSESLFDEIVASRSWAQRSRTIHGKEMLEPRLTDFWSLDSKSSLSPIIEEMRVALSRRYDVAFDSVGFNLYRDGKDSVAWHGDHIRKEVREPVVALVSLGHPRKILLRPKGGGASTPFLLESGDLFVTGGQTQRTWEHSIPKVAQAGPRISLAFRHGLMDRAYLSL